MYGRVPRHVPRASNVARFIVIGRSHMALRALRVRVHSNSSRSRQIAKRSAEQKFVFEKQKNRRREKSERHL
jgi:hypothetical protein